MTVPSPAASGYCATLLGDDIRNPRYIETVATVGYRFIGKVEVSEDVSGETEAAKEPPGLSGVGKKAGSRKRLWAWALTGGAALALCLAASFWYLHRPLPPPRITGYDQITHDGHQKTLVGTDGSRLYFNQGSLFSIAQAAISGTETAQVPVALPNPTAVDVSPDGSSLLVFSQKAEYADGFGTLWSVPILGGSARRLIGEAKEASFSPDGNSVVYITTQDEIWLVQSDGSDAHKIASAGPGPYSITFSPDGKIIRFWRDNQLWEISSGGSGLHEVMPGWHGSSSECCGKWTPDGKFFVFNSDDQIWALDERRGLFRRPPAEPVQLTSGPVHWGTPIPARDGKRILVEGRTPRGELSRYDKQTRKFLPFLGGISAQGVVFSLDGKSIAYVSDPEGVLWKANRNGTNPVQLSDPSIVAILPRWSPDSKQLAFGGYSRKNSEYRIYIVSSEGDSPPRSLAGSYPSWAFPYWLPDGHKIGFQAYPADKGGNTVNRILDLDTGRVTTVPGSDGLDIPRWSPDGRYIAAGRAEAVTNYYHLMLFDVKTQQWSQLALKGIVDSHEWSRDSRYIYFRRVQGDRGVYRISVKGGVEQKIVDLKDWQDEGWFGRYMGLDPTDAPLLLRDIGSDDIYALTLDQK